jgi:hypothetical protein
MDMDMDKDTEKAWHNWVVFTKGATISVVIVAAILSLMALFLTH